MMEHDTILCMVGNMLIDNKVFVVTLSVLRFTSSFYMCVRETFALYYVSPKKKQLQKMSNIVLFFFGS
jgi:hypothetical protein